jgi:hypothetical protein
MENAHCALLAPLVALQCSPHSSAPQATIQDQGQPTAASVPWVSSASTQTKIPCHAPQDSMPRKDLLNALIALLDPSVQALRYPLHTPVPVGTSHQASIKSHANRAQLVSNVRTPLWTLSHVMKGSLASGMLPIAKLAQPGITVHTEIRSL